MMRGIIIFTNANMLFYKQEFGFEYRSKASNINNSHIFQHIYDPKNQDEHIQVSFMN